MKKTYVKVTALICALILVVMVLGCALFTYIQIDKINTKYIEDIHRATKWSPADYEEEVGGTNNTQVEYYFANKFFKATYDHDIGFYGKTNWKWKTSDNTHTIESVNFLRSSVYFVATGDNKGSISFVIGDDTLNNGTYYYNEDSGISVRIIGGISDNNGNWDIIMGHADEEVTGPVKYSEKTANLDTEAKQKYDELNLAEATEKIDTTKTGWFTTYAVIYQESTFNKGIIDVKECNVFLFHPFSMVFAKYSYVYLMFALLLVVLLFIAVVSMRRMYKNRLQFEARTKSLTRSFAHELKTPLAVTKAYIENWDLVDEKDRPEVASKINSEVDHMTRMVNTLLDLSKMDSGDVKLNLEEVELYDLSKSCFKHLEKIAAEKEISFDFGKDKEDGEYKVSADLDMMQMVISNFMSNAIKYGKEKVSVFLSGDGNNVTFKITNDGDPISKKDQKKIWDLFYKKDKSGADRLNSNGVGLAVNKSILELHKAKFGVTDGGSGTTFWFEMKRIKE